VSSTGKSIHEHKGMGLVPEIFNETNLNKLDGQIAVGHVRYSTTGSSVAKNAQPFVASHGGKTLAIAHNGNLTNAKELRNKLEKKGSIFQTTMDSEIIVHLLTHYSKMGLEEALVKTLGKLQGAYSCALMTKDKLIAFRDPNGFRPLCLGLLDEGYIVSSETCALDLIEAQHIRDIDPGEILIIGEDELKSIKPFPERRKTLCIFEYIYFSRPDSVINGRLLYSARQAMGAGLAEEHPVEADIVVGVPDSATAAGYGYASKSGIPPGEGLIKNRYIGRTFIEPDQRIRDLGVKLKFNPLRSVLEGKRVVLVDDSIVRGTNAMRIVRAFRAAGARKIFFGTLWPMVIDSCFQGINTPTQKELIGARFNGDVEEVRVELGVDALFYMPYQVFVEHVLKSAPACMACTTGKRAVKFESSGLVLPPVD